VGKVKKSKIYPKRLLKNRRQPKGGTKTPKKMKTLTSQKVHIDETLLDTKATRQRKPC